MVVKCRGKAQRENNFVGVLQLTLLAVVVSASCRVRAADDLNAPQSIPLTHRNDRLGISLSIGQEGPRQYIFDTGSTQLNADFTEVPNIPGLKVIGNPHPYLYGTGDYGFWTQNLNVPEIKYYAAGNPDPVLITKNSSGFIIADNLDSINANAAHKSTDQPITINRRDGRGLYPDLNARALLAAGKPPSEGAYFGIFGAGDFLLSKTDGGSPLANATQSGYVVAANDTPNAPGCAPCTILNLSPSVKAQFAQTVPWTMNPNGANKQPFPGSGANASSFHEGSFRYQLVGPNGERYSGVGPVLLDSGTPGPLDNGGNPGAVPVVSGTIESLDPKTGKYRVAYTLDSPGRLDKGNLIIGLPFFLKNSVMFDLEDKATGYSSFFVSANNFTTDTPLAGQQGISTITPDMGRLGFAGVISGQGNLTLQPFSAVKLTGVNTYSGLTDIQPNARFYLAGPGSIEQSSSLRNDGLFDISEHGNYNPLWGVETSGNAIIRSLEGNGSVFLGDQTLALSQASGSFGGVLQDGGLGGGVGGGLTINGGIETLTGNNTYTGPTSINAQAMLVVNGSIVSPVSVNNAGVLGGSGAVGAVTVQSGGTVAPGNSIGALHTQDITFNPGSQYAVEVGPNGQSDSVQSTGKATLNGGQVALSLEHSPNLLAMSDVRSLLGQQYNILSASQGISGQFASVIPNYLFLGGSLTYQPDNVLLNIGRNDTRFDSVALTRNQRSVAAAADTLGLGNPVYESILASPTADQARLAFDQLSGKVHADIAATLMSDSRYLREAVNNRLLEAQELSTDGEIVSTENGGWVQFLGNNDNIGGDNNASGYSASTTGILLGLDTEVSDGWRVGAATGYTQTKLSAESSTTANSDNYHLSFYGGKRFDSVALRAGVASTWSNVETARGIVYGDQSDYEKSRYNARADQVFAEIGYTQWARFEPFANLTYLNFQSDSFNERGGASALHANDQSQNATLSVLGLRAHTDLPVSANSMVTLRGELGWQHQYASQDREASLQFKGSDIDFAVNSVPVSRDGGLLKASAEMALTKDTLLSLNYSGLLAGHDKSNGINAGVTFRF